MDFEKVAGEFLNGPTGEKLSGKKSELGKLIDTDDGKKVKAMLENSEVNLMDAVSKGDTKTLKKALSGILKTEEGARIADQIMKMMK